MEIKAGYMGKVIRDGCVGEIGCWKKAPRNTLKYMSDTGNWATLRCMDDPGGGVGRCGMVQYGVERGHRRGWSLGKSQKTVEKD